MILVDTSIWADHFRAGDAALGELLARRMVLMHPLVIGELALGNLSDRSVVIPLLEPLPGITIANHRQVLEAIEQRQWMAKGIGWVDAALIASVALHDGARLWTRDSRMAEVASELTVRS